MGKTKIAWTENVWNPLRGCSRVSEGCRHCYAETMAGRFNDPGLWGYGLAVIKSDGAHWTGKVKLVEEHLLDPLKWKKPRKIFVNSVSDLFHENVPDEWIDRIFAVMALCPQHTFQVLTKRSARMLAYMTKLDEEHQGDCWRGAIIEGTTQALYSKLHPNESSESISMNLAVHLPLPNVWIGVSVENQAAADERIPLLLKTPAKVRFISAEPLLESVNLWKVDVPARWSPEAGQYAGWDWHDFNGETPGGLDWIIAGCESGPGSRDVDDDAFRSLRDQCAFVDVPFFLKQMKVNGKLVHSPLLDGREWSEFPA